MQSLWLKLCVCFGEHYSNLLVCMHKTVLSLSINILWTHIRVCTIRLFESNCLSLFMYVSTYGLFFWRFIENAVTLDMLSVAYVNLCKQGIYTARRTVICVHIYLHMISCKQNRKNHCSFENKLQMRSNLFRMHLIYIWAY